MDCEAPSLRGFAPCGRISPDACGGTKWTAKPPLSGDLLPAVAFPLTPAAGQNGLRSPLSQGICSLRSHIPCRLRRALQKETKKPLEQALRHLRSLLRREGDSNPRNPQGVQQFSRLPRSTTPASLLFDSRCKYNCKFPISSKLSYGILQCENNHPYLQEEEAP